MLSKELIAELDVFFKSHNIYDEYHITKRMFSAWNLEIEPGWISLMKEAISKLKEMGWNGGIQQIKQKYGGIRLYLSKLTTEMALVVDEYERKSLKICETCGKDGQTYTDLRWWTTCCPEHYDIERVRQKKAEKGHNWEQYVPTGKKRGRPSSGLSKYRLSLLRKAQKEEAKKKLLEEQAKEGTFVIKEIK